MYLLKENWKPVWHRKERKSKESFNRLTIIIDVKPDSTVFKNIYPLCCMSYSKVKGKGLPKFSYKIIIS